MIRPIGCFNRRRYPRFKVDGGLFVIHADFGQVQEIGIGGAVFTYIEKNREHNGFPERGLVFSRRDREVVELPFRTVSDISIRQSTFSIFNVRQRIVTFDGLSDGEVELLEQLILKNVAILPPEDETCGSRNRGRDRVTAMPGLP